MRVQKHFALQPLFWLASKIPFAIRPLLCSGPAVSLMCPAGFLCSCSNSVMTLVVQQYTPKAGSSNRASQHNKYSGRQDLNNRSEKVSMWELDQHTAQLKHEGMSLQITTDDVSQGVSVKCAGQPLGHRLSTNTTRRSLRPHSRAVHSATGSDRSIRCGGQRPRTAARSLAL